MSRTGQGGAVALQGVERTNREQVIGTLKAAFVQGLLGKGGFDLRVLGRRSRRGPARNWPQSLRISPRG